MPAPLVKFTDSTENPKLAWLRDLLTRHGIPNKVEGATCRAPILKVSELFLDDAWTLLNAPAKSYGIRTKKGVDLDDVRDAHPFFQRWAEKESYYMEKAWPHIEDYEE